MLTKEFWSRALERAIKSAAQSAIIVFGASEVTNAFTFDWQAAAGAALAGFTLSVLTSLASTRVGDSDDPSVI